MLFRCRYSEEDPKDRTAFLQSRNGGGERVEEEDKRMFKAQLMAATPSLKTDEEFNAEVFYRVSSPYYPRTLSLHGSDFGRLISR